MEILRTLPDSMPSLFDPSHSVRVVAVAQKYDQPDERPIERIPEYTIPGGPNSYHCSKVSTSWTQGFFPGLIWLIYERSHLLPSAVTSSFDRQTLVRLARRWQDSFKHLASPAPNHDQGFRFQLSFGHDWRLTGNTKAKDIMLLAAESLVPRYSAKVGCIRSWDEMGSKHFDKVYGPHNLDEHFLVIIDNMMNLDMLYQAAEITLDPKYERIANSQAEQSSRSHVRPDFTTCHVVNMDQKTGEPIEFLTAQGYADDSCWARGQAWAIYGYSQCAMRTGRSDFRELCGKLADVFCGLLPQTGVPWWDFSAPKPCPYDASAATVAACGMLRLARILLPVDQQAAGTYLTRAFKLVSDTLRECAAPPASLREGHVEFGEGGWETILKHSTINGNPQATRLLMDHGLVYADYYLLEFGNEALKLKAECFSV